MKFGQDKKVEDNGLFKTTVETKVELSDQVVKGVQDVLNDSNRYLTDFTLDIGNWWEPDKLSITLVSDEYEITIVKKQ